jgi:serine protease Do|tara:strand:- start:823 stop:1854 length:1032 start_codon:yes stop_codon:yes gene_type:complete
MPKSNILLIYSILLLSAASLYAIQNTQSTDIDAAKSISRVFEKVAETISPSLVTIQSKQEVLVRRRNGVRPRDINLGLGSGLIISDNGYIVTNAHVIEQADEIAVSLSNGETINAEIIGTDPKTDIALIKIEQKDLVAANLGDSDQVRVGQFVIAAGNPFGLSASITSGIVSAKGRSNVGIADYEDFIQTDASINQGNSGGPLVNLDAEVIGINTAMLGRNGNIGIGFAIPINLVKDIVSDLIDDGEVTRGFLGVRINEVTQEYASQMNVEFGIFVSNVNEDSPAMLSGIKAGDIITHLNGNPAIELAKFRLEIAGFRPSEEVVLTIVRGDQTIEITVKLGSL